MAQAALLFPRHVKPNNAPPRVNLAHPRAKGLAAFLLWPAATGIYDAVTGQFSTKNRGTSNACSTIATVEGRVLHTPGTEILQISPTRNPTGATPASFAGSAIARLRHNAHPSGNAFVVQYQDTTNFQGPVIGFDSSGHARGGVNVSNGLAGGSDAVDWVNKWATLGATAATATDNADGLLFVNGAQRASGNSTHLNSAVALSRITVGTDGGSYSPAINCDVAWIACFNRILSPAEFAWWYRHPFEVLRQTRQPMFYSLPAAAAGVADDPGARIFRLQQPAWR